MRARPSVDPAPRGTPLKHDEPSGDAGTHAAPPARQASPVRTAGLRARTLTRALTRRPRSREAVTARRTRARRGPDGRRAHAQQAPRAGRRRASASGPTLVVPRVTVTAVRRRVVRCSSTATIAAGAAPRRSAADDSAGVAVARGAVMDLGRDRRRRDARLRRGGRGARRRAGAARGRQGTAMGPRVQPTACLNRSAKLRPTPAWSCKVARRPRGHRAAVGAIRAVGPRGARRVSTTAAD